MDQKTIRKTVYGLRGIPPEYANISFEDTDTIKTKLKKYQLAIENAPTSGILLVSGTSAPVLNTLFDAKRKIIGLDFIDIYNSRFEEDKISYDGIISDVVLLKNIGLEPASSTTFASKLLSSIIGKYTSHNVLLILETHLTPSQFTQQYGIPIVNTMILKPKAETNWIN
jgi:hypothetical protein